MKRAIRRACFIFATGTNKKHQNRCNVAVTSITGTTKLKGIALSHLLKKQADVIFVIVLLPMVVAMGWDGDYNCRYEIGINRHFNIYAPIW